MVLGAFDDLLLVPRRSHRNNASGAAREYDPLPSGGGGGASTQKRSHRTPRVIVRLLARITNTCRDFDLCKPTEFGCLACARAPERAAEMLGTCSARSIMDAGGAEAMAQALASEDVASMRAALILLRHTAQLAPPQLADTARDIATRDNVPCVSVRVAALHAVAAHVRVAPSWLGHDDAAVLWSVARHGRCGGMGDSVAESACEAVAAYLCAQLTCAQLTCEAPESATRTSVNEALKCDGSEDQGALRAALVVALRVAEQNGGNVAAVLPSVTRAVPFAAATEEGETRACACALVPHVGDACANTLVAGAATCLQKSGARDDARDALDALALCSAVQSLRRGGSACSAARAAAASVVTNAVRAWLAQGAWTRLKAALVAWRRGGGPPNTTALIAWLEFVHDAMRDIPHSQVDLRLSVLESLLVRPEDACEWDEDVEVTTFLEGVAIPLISSADVDEASAAWDACRILARVGTIPEPVLDTLWSHCTSNARAGAFFVDACVGELGEVIARWCARQDVRSSLLSVEDASSMASMADALCSCASANRGMMVDSSWKALSQKLLDACGASDDNEEDADVFDDSKRALRRAMDRLRRLLRIGDPCVSGRVVEANPLHFEEEDDDEDDDDDEFLLEEEEEEEAAFRWSGECV